MITGTAVALTALTVTTASTRAYGAERHAPSAAATATSYSVNGDLTGVADVSRTEAWAVGWSGTDNASKTLLLHWNGQDWSPVTSPQPVTGELIGITEISPTNILAVGYQQTSSTTIVPLVLHWNGSGWSRVPGTPKVNGAFAAIGDAGGTLLAVGGLYTPPMLLMERTGTTWRDLPVPAAPGYMESIVVTGSKSAWAAGDTVNAKQVPTGDVLLRWNGSGWKAQSFPLHGTNENLWSLAATPSGAIWAIGDSHNNADTTSAPLSMLWNGSSWRKVTVPAPADSALGGVGVIPGGTAWAVGGNNGSGRTLTLSWTGTAWKQIASPNPMASWNYLNAVSASSTGDAWAVGFGAATKTGAAKTFILHWNGAAWH